MKVEHLGDGAYVRINENFNGEIGLFANHRDPRFASDRIYLDQRAVKLLVRLLAEENEMTVEQYLGL